MDADKFLKAQNDGIGIEGVLSELRAGKKRSHWMWFVFPQLRELGRTKYAKDFGLDGLQDAREWLGILAHRDR